MRRWAALGAVVVLAGCASAAPSTSIEPASAISSTEAPGLAEVRAFVARASLAYKIDPPPVIVADPGNATFIAVYRRGALVFSPRALTSPSRDKYAAHELAHHILRHDLPSMRTPEEKEHQANIEAVRILVVANGVTEEQALRVVLGHLKGRTGTATGHASPCEEIRVVSAAFPAQRGWSAALECR